MVSANVNSRITSYDKFQKKCVFCLDYCKTHTFKISIQLMLMIMLFR